MSPLEPACSHLAVANGYHEPRRLEVRRAGISSDDPEPGAVSDAVLPASPPAPGRAGRAARPLRPAAPTQRGRHTALRGTAGEEAGPGGAVLAAGPHRAGRRSITRALRPGPAQPPARGPGPLPPCSGGEAARGGGGGGRTMAAGGRRPGHGGCWVLGGEREGLDKRIYPVAWEQAGWTASGTHGCWIGGDTAAILLGLKLYNSFPFLHRYITLMSASQHLISQAGWNICNLSIYLSR